MSHRPLTGVAPRRARTIFLSDTHLGCRYARSNALLEFLNEFQPDRLYLVGDIIDGWRLRKSWYWSHTYSAIVRRLIELLDQGTQIFYTPGNHDEFLRQFVRDLGGVTLVDEIVHETADGRRLLVIHGDQFDAVVRHARWLSLIGDVGYNGLLWLNGVFNACRQRLGFGYWSLSSYIKKKVKQATSAISRFEEAASHYARDRQCDGVVCGHIHTPVIQRHADFTYYNTGDWVESCTALIEDWDGELRLIRWSTLDREDRDLPLSSPAWEDLDHLPNGVQSTRPGHGEDLLQPVGGGSRSRYPSPDDGGSTAD